VQPAHSMSEQELGLFWKAACEGDLAKHRALRSAAESGFVCKRWGLRVLWVSPEGSVRVVRGGLDPDHGDAGLQGVLESQFGVCAGSEVRLCGLLVCAEASVEECVRALSGPDCMLTVCVRSSIRNDE
jgi:hypothetical protein